MLSIRHILFPFDFSVHGVQAAPFVRALAQRFNARVTLFSTGSPAWGGSPVDISVLRDDSTRQAPPQLQCDLEQAVAVGDIVTTVAEDAWQEDADLVVVGRGNDSESHGRWRSHAYGISRRSPCPVLSA